MTRVLLLCLCIAAFAGEKDVLVTGGAGYVGSQTCKVLYEAGYTPITYDNLSQGREELVKWGKLIVGDLVDQAKLEKVLKEHQPIAVIHFAAATDVGESVKDPAKYYLNNVLGTFHLLEAMRACKIPHLIFSSTCATYGEPKKIPMDESHPQNPINPYGRSKLTDEWMIEDYVAAYDLSAVSLRYFNAAGADLEGETGDLRNPPKLLIPIALQVALGKRSEFVYFGTDFLTPDGTGVRDYIHTLDLASAHIKALEYLKRGGKSLALNLGSGQGHSVKEVVKEIESLIGQNLKSQIGPRREGDPSKLIANPQKAEKTLNWKTQHSDLEIIIKSTYNYCNYN